MSEPLTPESQPAPEKGVADILVEAFQLYRAHAKPLLLTCALLFVPAAIINSMALSAILGPTMAIARAGDPAAALAGSLSVYLLQLVGTLMTAFFLYGIVVPLTNGALTIAAADRILGGQAESREVLDAVVSPSRQAAVCGHPGRHRGHHRFASSSSSRAWCWRSSSPSSRRWSSSRASAAERRSNAARRWSAPTGCGSRSCWSASAAVRWVGHLVASLRRSPRSSWPRWCPIS